jgi:hypothetical protein
LLPIELKAKQSMPKQNNQNILRFPLIGKTKQSQIKQSKEKQSKSKQNKAKQIVLQFP